MNLQENNRIPSFDYIRIIALLGILLCHSCFEPAVPYPWLGRFLGVTFNFIFLVLSAFLFGLGWAAKGYIVYHRDFVIKRMAKLSRTYYPYLVFLFLFLFLYLTQNYFSIQKAATHLIYLPWFDKIEGFGHLWFMTMIMVCYIGCWMLTKVSEKIINCNILTISALIGGSVCLDYLVTISGFPGYIIPYTIGYILIFAYSRNVIVYIEKIPMPINWLQFVVINTCGIWMFYEGLFEYNNFYAYLIGIICALSVFTLLYRALTDFPPSRLILWLSGISFEVYLVHEFFLGRYSVYRLIDNPILGFILLVIISILSASILRFSAKRVPRKKLNYL